MIRFKYRAIEKILAEEDSEYTVLVETSKQFCPFTPWIRCDSSNAWHQGRRLDWDAAVELAQRWGAQELERRKSLTRAKPRRGAWWP